MWFDMSEWQKDVDFVKLSKTPGLEGVILRVQHGYSHPDTKYKEYVVGCKANNIRFGTYAYAAPVSINDAIAEADSAFNLVDKDSQFFVVDAEEITTKNPADYIPAIQAFIDRLKARGLTKVGLYSGESFYVQHGLSTIKADFLWLANYGVNDGQPHNKPVCDLWQYTSVGIIDGISTNVDISMVSGLPGRKDNTYFSGLKPVDYQIGNLTTQMIIDLADFLKQTNFYSETLGGVKIGHFFAGTEQDQTMENFLKNKGWYYVKG